MTGLPEWVSGQLADLYRTNAIVRAHVHLAVSAGWSEVEALRNIAVSLAGTLDESQRLLTKAIERTPPAPIVIVWPDGSVTEEPAR